MAESVPNHTIDPQTGFVESNGWMNAFDADRKTQFLELYKSNGIRLRRACREMGLSESTVTRHLRYDSAFKEKFDAVERDYIEELESVSRSNALNPKSVIERIFQLKCILPEKYGQENKPRESNITINIDSATLEFAKKRSQAIDAEIISTPELNSKSVDSEPT